RRLRTVREY
ncbi:hypothetical protein INT47_006298, partial [Mucor saturninus]